MWVGGKYNQKNVLLNCLCLRVFNSVGGSVNHKIKKAWPKDTFDSDELVLEKLNIFPFHMRLLVISLVLVNKQINMPYLINSCLLF